LSSTCPYCAQENAAGALVCSSCSRDIAVPQSLLAERDGLSRKRDMVRQELAETRSELERLRRLRKHRSV
jgi:hypothetical protein